MSFLGHGYQEAGLSARLFDRSGNEITRVGPLTDILEGSQIVLTEEDGFSDHSLSFFGASRDALLVMAQPKTKVEIREIETDRVVCRGIIEDPEADLTDTGTVLKVALKNVTYELTYNETGRGRIYNTTIAAILADLGQIQPGWSAVATDTTGLVPTGGAVQWSCYPGMTANGSSVVKASTGAFNWDTGANSIQSFGSGDGAITFQMPTTNLVGMAGLGASSSINFGVMQRGFYFAGNGRYQIYENGSAASPPLAHAAGDQFTIVVQGGQTIYYQNQTRVGADANAVVYPQFAMAFGFSPGFAVYNAYISYYTTPSQALYNVRLEQATPLYGVFSIAQALLIHVRQGKAADGSPGQVIEVGKFGTINDFWLVDPLGVSPDAIRANPSARVVKKVTKKRQTSAIFNHGLPLGSGQGDAQVDMRRLWRILYDPAYPNFGKYGNRADSVFPEYDPAYPLYALPNTNPVVAPGLTPIPAARALIPGKQKPDGTGLMPAVTNDGRFDIYMGNSASQQTWGVITASLSDQTYAYTTSDVPAQEMVQRALYVASKAKLQNQGVDQYTYTVVTDGYGSVPSAGDKIHLQYGQTVIDDTGAFSPWQEDIILTVVKVTRAYSASGKEDTWILTTDGNRPATSSNTQAATQRTVQALRLVPDIQTIALPVGGSVQHLDDTHPVLIPFITPDDVFRVASVSLYVDPLNPRSPVNIAGAINENSGSGITTSYAASNGTGTPYTKGVVSSNSFGTTRSGNVISLNNNGPTNSGGVISASAFGPTSTGNVLGTPTVGGYSGPNVNNQYTQTFQDVGSTTGSKTGLSTIKTDLRHAHALQVGSNANSPANSALHFIQQSGRNSFLETTGSAGGQLWTNDWVPGGVTLSADPNHGHLYDVPALSITQQHYIADYHAMTHYHDISHYHDMQHSHDISHVHDIDHYHFFPHTHILLGGVFDITAEPAVFYVYVDGVDISPQVIDSTGGVGPWKGAFAIPDLMVSPYAIQKLSMKGRHTIEVHDVGQTAGQHGFTAIQTSGHARIQIGSIGITAWQLN